MKKSHWLLWYIFIGAVVFLALALWGDVIAAWLGGWGMPQ